MADFYRVIRLAFWLVVGSVIGASFTLAHADTPEHQYSGRINLACPDSGWTTAFSSAASAAMSCRNQINSTNQSVPQNCTYTTSNGLVLGGNCRNPDGTTSYYASIVAVAERYWCGVSGVSVASGASCPAIVCPDGQTLQADGTCKGDCPAAGTVAPTNARSGTAGNIGWQNAAYTSGYKNFGPSQGCYGGCAVQSKTSACVRYNGIDYNCGMFGVTYTGGACTGSQQTIPAAGTTPTTAQNTLQQAYNCAQQGMGYGTVNGAVVCVGSAPSSNNTSGTTTGTTKTPTSTTTVTNNTSCTAEGSCTTTTTTTTVSGGSGPNGTGAGSTTTTTTADTNTPKADYCAEHPNSTVCKDPTPSTFAGACDAPPTCTGDAVQCAQATAAWQLRCDINKEPTGSAYDTGKVIAGGGVDPLGNPLAADKETTVNLGTIVSQAAGQRSLTSSCIVSPSFIVAGRTYTFDTTLFCQFASIIGYLMVAASSIIAIRMVTAGGST